MTFYVYFANDITISQPMNRMAFKNYQSMNLVHRTKEGSELWLGDYYAATNLSLLKQHDIRSVLTSAAMLGISYPKDLNMNHKTINAFDIPSYRMTPHYDEAFRFIDDALKKGHLLVHCAAGISRSTTFVLVYLMRGEDMTFKNAMDYVRNKRSIICPNYGFQNELKRYELTLKKTPKKEKEAKEDTFANSNYSAFSQKKAVFNFISQQKKGNVRADDKFLSTVGGKRLGVQQNESLNKSKGTDYNGYLRGKSMNYSKKLGNTFSSGKDNDVNKLTKQFLTFKLQTPKIVTIKK